MTDTHLQIALPPNADTLALPELLEVVTAQARELPVGAAQEHEARCEALAAVFGRHTSLEERARRMALVSLVLARRIGAELGEGKQGRPKEEIPLPDLKPSARKSYRACAIPTDEEFQAWASKTKAPSKGGLARYGRKLLKERDQETGEPIPPSPPGDSPGPDPAHRSHVWAGAVTQIAELVDQLRDDVSQAPAHVKRTAGELALLLRKAKTLIQTITPQDPESDS